MIPSIHGGKGGRKVVAIAIAIVIAIAAATMSFAGAVSTAGPAPRSAAGEAPATALPSVPANMASKDCLASGDGYLRARLAGAVNARIDWANRGTRCEGEAKSRPPGVRMSFQRGTGAKPNLLFVFGLTGVLEGQSAHESGVNLTILVQGTPRIFGTLSDSRCTVDSLSQKPLPGPHLYRVEVRGFCTQPAHAVRGDGDVLVSTFEFAGQVNYGEADTEAGAVK